jgi:hypothetical protein
MPRDLQSTMVTLDGLAADDAHAALLTLGRAVDELDRAAHDAGFRLELRIVRDERGTSREPE